jgi:long-chain acyl-CoA synthetase
MLGSMERPWLKHYDAGVPSSIDYEELPVHAFLARSAERAPDRTAVAFSNAKLSYRELYEDTQRLAKGFSELGVEPGSSVAIHLPNIPQIVIAYYAALSLGARVVLTNPLYTPREIQHQWEDAECDLVVTTDFLFDQRLRGIREALSAKHYVLASIPDYLRFPLNRLAPWKLRRQKPPLYASFTPGPGLHGFKQLVRAHTPDPPRPDIELDEVAVLQYTGGTTGVSKGAMLTHRNLTVNAQQTDAWFSDTDYAQEVVLTCLPLFHVFGMTVCMNLAIRSAGTLVLIANPRDIRALIRGITTHKVTLFPGVPALYNTLNHYPGIDDADLSSIRYCISGSAPIPPDVLERFEKLTGAKIIEGFGLSETSPLTHANPLSGLRKIGTVGTPVSDTDARIVDVENPDRALVTGEEGELAIRGPQVMKGYWKRPDETAKTMHEEWLLTGDLACMDEDGYFKIVGRKKDMINASGLKVFPDEVDHVLMAHDQILEAATIGIPHAKRGETVKSFIVRQPGSSVTAEDIEAYCRENLAAYKIPREIEFLDELPKSSVLKVLRRELRDRELAKRSPGS